MQFNINNNTIRIHGELNIDQWSAFIDACDRLIQQRSGGEVPGIDAPVARAPLPIPDDFDVEMEQRRAKQGGCCGEPME